MKPPTRLFNRQFCVSAFFILKLCSSPSEAKSHADKWDEPRRHIGCESVSIIQLVANPGKYSGKKVLVQGYFLYDWPPAWQHSVKPVNPSMGTLYLTKELADYGAKDCGNGVEVNFDQKHLVMKPDGSTEKDFDKKHVSVEGIFRRYTSDYPCFPIGIDVYDIKSLEIEKSAEESKSSPKI